MSSGNRPYDDADHIHVWGDLIPVADRVYVRQCLAASAPSCPAWQEIDHREDRPKVSEHAR